MRMLFLVLITSFVFFNGFVHGESAATVDVGLHVTENKSVVFSSPIFELGNISDVFGLLTNMSNELAEAQKTIFSMSQDQTVLKDALAAANIPLRAPVEFPFVGYDERFVVPDRVTRIMVKMWGAGGGDCDNRASSAYTGTGSGGAGFTQCELAVTPGEELNIIVGQGGHGCYGPYTAYGGGSRGTTHLTVGGPHSGGGGGGTRIERSDGTVLAVAGGGGGSAYDELGGPGGGLVGGSGTRISGVEQAQGGGQVSGGVFSDYLQGGWGDAGCSNCGGGGGGYYGGAGGTYSCCASGAGGSGYIGGCVTDGSETLAADSIGGTGIIPGGVSDPEYPGSNTGYGSETENIGANGYLLIQYFQEFEYEPV